ncbi:serine/threonine-protein kinase tor-like [Schistocerca gregaria]|uniref:serine/threonine-protein kinase tor-like n=1 Tax=Schistocerca gregaria TaxID=7010 RepID=UPI00211DD4D7|nr:serine/threonine-protein kinase tor-like [Schistocerca gregaria]
MKVCGNTIFEFQKLVFQQLSIIVSIIKQYTYDYQNQLFEICLTYWSDPKLIEHIIALIEQIFFALGDKFSSCLVFLLPKMLQTLQESAQNVRVVQGILRCFKAFGQMVENCIHLILPVVMQLIVDSPKVLFYSQNAYSSPPPRPYGPESDVAKSKQIQFVAICYLSELTLNHDISKYAISIIHHITKYLEHAHSDMVEPCVEVLSNIAVRLNQNFEVFVPMIYATFSKLSIRSIRFNIICQSILNKKPIPIIPSNIRASSIFSSSSEGHQPDGCDKQEQEADSNYYLDNFSFTSEFDSKNGLLNFFWNTGQSFTKADWYEWFRRFSIVLLSGSSSQALRCCVPLVKAQYSLALELFNVGFISCWEQLSDELRMQLTDSLKNALSSNIPAEILQILLNLVEFLEHHEQCLPIDNKTLASLAIKCHAYAKALHYKEAEFFQQMSPALMEDIIFLNYKLQLHEAAQGMLKLAQDTGGVVIKLSWYEKLIRWSTALEAYESLQLKHPDDIEITVGRMRCMHDLGDWDALSDLCRKTWALQKNGPKKLEIATLALSAALNSFQWDMIETYVDYLPVQSLDGSFYRAFMYVYKQDSQQAADYIAVARELAATELTALIGESYSCAYSVVVRIQQLTELEEILMIKQWNGKYPEKEKNILNLWKKRLQGVERNVEVWQSLLNVRSLVEPPRSVVYWWTKFANLVRKSDRPKKAQRILTYLLTGQNAELSADDPVPDTFPMVKYAYLNLLWQTPKTSEWAYRKMEEWVSHFSANTIISARDKARCYAKLSCWHLRAYGEHLNDAAIQRIVRTSKLAIENAPDWYRAWHVWAYANYRFVSHLEKSSDHANLDCYLLSAITGLIKAIVLSSKNNLQDILQLLMLWFKYGTKKDVELAMLDGFNVISVEKWLLVIPQLMARVHASHRSVSQGIHSILTALGKSHPQMLVFPLMVAKRSPYPLRASAAQSILTSIRSHSMELVDEAILVSTELIRIAILWKEKWYKGLDEASYYYYVEKKVDSMTIVLQHLNDMLEKGAETLSEQAFIKAFGKDLSKAWEEVKDYLKTKNASSIQAAWKLYGHVFRAIKRQFMQDSDRIHLKNVSPRLLGMSNLSLSVPGTYRVGSAVIRIKRFNPVLKVIPSKRKPRKVIVNGMDGVDYGFLLKGHEDLRQDERVMQLFGLVNTFLSSDPNTSKVHLSIRRFEVVPLSSNTGLIEWVPHCDTIHELIKHYRKLHSIPLDAEQIIITSLVPKPDISSYYKLTLMQKVCVFQAALDGTSRLDLGRAFYLNSKGAEDWLERRTSYTRSLAVISIVGYILGLGDRHPNNFLLSRSSGKILHIDFGDCFEVAMQRESHPEKVPFRLTRMMVGAMEACGICGTFRITCESVMRVLRSNSDSILTVLEAFVHDPFINWRLVTPFIGPFSYTGTLEDCANTLATHQNHPSSIDLEGEGCIRAPAAATSASRKIDINNLCAPDTDMHETLNSESLKAIQRVSNKLSGADFPGKGPLNEATQVGFLIREATSIENLCSAFLGFCAYW